MKSEERALYVLLHAMLEKSLVTKEEYARLIKEMEGQADDEKKLR